MACPTRITMSCCPSKRVVSAGLECVHSLPFQDGPLPRVTMDVGGLNGCLAAFNEYVGKVKATGKGATCFASIVRGFRTPPGFKKANVWQQTVNLDASHPELDTTAAA